MLSIVNPRVIANTLLLSSRVFGYRSCSFYCKKIEYYVSAFYINTNLLWIWCDSWVYDIFHSQPALLRNKIFWSNVEYHVLRVFAHLENSWWGKVWVIIISRELGFPRFCVTCTQVGNSIKFKTSFSLVHDSFVYNTTIAIKIMVVGALHLKVATLVLNYSIIGNMVEPWK